MKKDTNIQILLKNFWKSLWKYEKDFFKAYIFIWLLIAIIRITWYFTLIKDEWIWIFSKIFIYEILIIIWWYIFTKTEAFEKWLLNNFSKLIFFIILTFLLLPTHLVNNNLNILYISWWLFAFWYGYKKYERDKELELIEKFIKRAEKNNTEGLINQVYEIEILMSKKYIDKLLYSELVSLICWKIYYKILFNDLEREMFWNKISFPENQEWSVNTMKTIFNFIWKVIEKENNIFKNQNRFLETTNKEKNMNHNNNEKRVKDLEKFITQYERLLNLIQNDFNFET